MIKTIKRNHISHPNQNKGPLPGKKPLVKDLIEINESGVLVECSKQFLHNLVKFDIDPRVEGIQDSNFEVRYKA